MRGWATSARPRVSLPSAGSSSRWRRSADAADRPAWSMAECQLAHAR
jgi:hypothetical protein